MPRRYQTTKTLKTAKNRQSPLRAILESVSIAKQQGIERETKASTINLSELIPT